MAGIAKATIVGHLGRDPEMRYMPNGNPVTNFSVAVSRNSKSSEGESREETEWFDISCFNRLAEIANEYLQKGRQVYIEGRIRTRSWDDRNTGEKRFRVEIIASELQMLGSRGEPGMGGAERSQRPAAAPSGDNFDFDNMPF